MTEQERKTMAEVADVFTRCRKVFADKLEDYGASWRIMRPEAITDQIFIKAKRIRSIQTKGSTAVGEGILPEFIAIVNYGIIGIIQLRNGYADTKDMPNDVALNAYDTIAKEARELLEKKNHDYDEAWRSMRVLSYVDFILTKVQRAKEIEDNAGITKVSEGIDSNYFDMINYAAFGVIKLSDGNNA